MSEAQQEVLPTTKMMINLSLATRQPIRSPEGTSNWRLESRIEGTKVQVDGILGDETLAPDLKRDKILTMISNLVTHAHDSEAAAVAIGYFAHNTALNEIIPLEPYLKTKEVTSAQREQVWEREVEIARQLVEEAGLSKDFLEKNFVLVPVR
jgi:hypothetical protein